jgi:hypothetical protein
VNWNGCRRAGVCAAVTLRRDLVLSHSFDSVIGRQVRTILSRGVLPIAVFVIECATLCQITFAVDQTFNISFIAERDPLAHTIATSDPNCLYCVYGDVWVDNGYVFMGTDVNNGGMHIFSYNNAGIPTYLTTYAGDQFEDVEVYDGLGFFGSDVTTGSSGTGVDIVDLRIPFDPELLSRFNGSDCNLVGCGHNKIHTVSVVGDYFYTTDNSTDVVKIVKINKAIDPIDPSIITVNPQVVSSLDLGLNPQQSTATGSHEVIVRNNRMYIASKDNNHNSDFGWVHIYDVSNPASPQLLKKFTTFSTPGGTVTLARSHTAVPSEDGKTLVVAEERPNGNVYIFDISNINQVNDPDNPLWKATLNRTNVGIDAHSPHHPHLHGNLLFLPWYEAGLQVFNISNPAAPVRVGSFDTFTGTSTAYNGDWGVDVSLGLDRVFLSDRTRGLIVVDARGVVQQGDYDQNMVVDAGDYTAWRSTFGNGNSGLHIGALADGNYNGVVDAADYVLYRKNFGKTGPSHPGSGSGFDSGTAPEPSAMWLFAMGVGMSLGRRRTRCR